MVETATGFSGVLNLSGVGSTIYGQDITKLSVEVTFETADIARVKITDATNARWEVPESLIERPHATAKPASTNYKFSFTESPFSFELTRVSDGRSLFKLDDSFIFKDQYPFSSPRTSTPAPPLLVSASPPASRRPFAVMVNGTAHGAMLMNSNGMDIQLSDERLTFKPIGGIFDLYVFAGSSPAAVVDQYTQIVGRPMMMPYWSLGFHNCKYGYTGIKEVEEVVAGYAAAGFPLDTQWMDIDYMQNYKDFTLDSTNFPQAEVSSFVKGLHANGQHFVPIIDPGIM
eukprot:gene25930-29291_t